VPELLPALKERIARDVAAGLEAAGLDVARANRDRPSSW